MVEIMKQKQTRFLSKEFSVDQLLLYRSCLAIIEGVCPPDLMKRTLGKVHHARWITLALHINFLYMTCPEPSEELYRLCWFVINVYCTLWFSAKKNWRATFAPILTFEALKLIKEREKLCPVFQRGFGHWAHLEQVLLCCLRSDDIDLGSKGIVVILKIREGKTKHDEGPKRKKKGNHASIRFELHPLVLDVPSNSQHVERFIRVTTEIGTKSADSTLRDGMVHATVAHRQLRGKKESKMDFSKPVAQ